MFPLSFHTEIQCFTINRKLVIQIAWLLHFCSKLYTNYLKAAADFSALHYQTCQNPVLNGADVSSTSEIRTAATLVLLMTGK